MSWFTAGVQVIEPHGASCSGGTMMLGGLIQCDQGRTWPRREDLWGFGLCTLSGASSSSWWLGFSIGGFLPSCKLFPNFPGLWTCVLGACFGVHWNQRQHLLCWQHGLDWAFWGFCLQPKPSSKKGLSECLLQSFYCAWPVPQMNLGYFCALLLFRPNPCTPSPPYSSWACIKAHRGHHGDHRKKKTLSTHVQH